MSTGEFAIISSSLTLFGIALGIYYQKGKINAETKRIGKESVKTEADTLKSLADVYQIKINADIQIAQQWERIVGELRKELELEKAECDSKLMHMQKKIDAMKIEIDQLKNKRA